MSARRRAPEVAMETWSSWLADVGRLVTLLGWARHWFSAASAAAGTIGTALGGQMLGRFARGVLGALLR
jgi:hypothetical protein